MLVAGTAAVGHERPGDNGDGNGDRGDGGDRGACGEVLGGSTGDRGTDALPRHPPGGFNALDLAADGIRGQREQLFLQGQSGGESRAGEEHRRSRDQDGRVDREQQVGDGEQQSQGKA